MSVCVSPLNMRATENFIIVSVAWRRQNTTRWIICKLPVSIPRFIGIDTRNGAIILADWEHLSMYSKFEIIIRGIAICLDLNIGPWKHSSTSAAPFANCYRSFCFELKIISAIIVATPAVIRFLCTAKIYRELMDLRKLDQKLRYDLELAEEFPLLGRGKRHSYWITWNDIFHDFEKSRRFCPIF